MIKLSVFLLCLSVVLADITSPAQVLELPSYGAVKEVQYSGHLKVSECGAYLYFWLVESKNDPDNSPTVIWLNGGPGSSSFLGFFYENGPYQVNDSNALKDNPFSWNTNANYLMIDQPAGVGLSFVEKEECYAQVESVAIDQLYIGLQEFYRLYPKYAKNDLYIFGESYAGKYVPELATVILENQEYASILKGIGIGNGWVNPIVQQSTYEEYAYSHALIGSSQRKIVQDLYDKCNFAVIHSLPNTTRESDKLCNKIEQYIVNASGGINVYDIRMIGDYTFDNIANYLNQASVRAALHVDPKVGNWTDQSDTVAFLLEEGEQAPADNLFINLLDKIKVLIYNGEYDMDCNFMGTDLWLEQLQWPLQSQFNQLNKTIWNFEGKVAGLYRGIGNLQQLVVYNAGHLVPTNQPAVALEMLNKFINNSSFGPNNNNGIFNKAKEVLDQFNDVL